MIAVGHHPRSQARPRRGQAIVENAFRPGRVIRLSCELPMVPLDRSKTS